MDRAVSLLAAEPLTHREVVSLLDSRLPVRDAAWSWNEADDLLDGLEFRPAPSGVVRVRVTVDDGTVSLEEFDAAGVSLGEVGFRGDVRRNLDVLTLAVVVAVNRVER